MRTFQHTQPGNDQALATYIQPQLEIGKEDDEHEKEANHVADKVMRMKDTPDKVRMMSAGKEEAKMKDEDEGKIQMMRDEPFSIRKMSDGDGGAMIAPENVEQGISGSKGNGNSLSPALQQEMGTKIGADFSGVKVHTDENAAQMNKEISAKAFTHGNDIYFNSGQYNPQSNAGKHLLAHELTHTVQQQQGVRRSIQRKIVIDPGAPKATKGAVARAAALMPMTDAKVKEMLNSIDSGKITSYNDIIDGKGKEYDFVGGSGQDGKDYRKQLIKDIIMNMHKVSTLLYFDHNELVTEVRKRAVTSLDMRTTQGKSSGNMPAGYPSASLSARVNAKAKPYWDVHQQSGNVSYHFTLTKFGKENAYKALYNLLFIHQTEKSLRTLMHCDYMVSAIHYKVMAESMGTAQFDDAVKTGKLVIDLTSVSYTKLATDKDDTPLKSLTRQTISSENDIIIGDHLIFYNHVAYNDLNKVQKQSWRLENAIVIDGLGDKRRFQGHGYFTPYVRSHFINAMISKFNELVDKGAGVTSKIPKTTKEKSDAQKKVNSLYAYNINGTLFEPVKVVGGKWTINYHKFGYWDDKNAGDPLLTMPFRRVTAADYPAPFVFPGASGITVTRPKESIN